MCIRDSDKAAKLPKIPKFKWPKWCDKRLKDNIKKIGVDNGFNVYSWTWNEIAGSTYDLYGDDIGFIAQELPKNVTEYDEYGYLYIKSEPLIKLIDNIKVNTTFR